MNSQRRQTRKYRGLNPIAVALCALTLSTSALADSIKLSGAWIDNVTIQDATGGNLDYTTASGNDVEKPLASVEGLKMSAYPELEAAQAAMAAGKFTDAVALEQKVLASVRQPWLRQWIQAQLVVSLDKAGHAPEAVEAYLQLVKDKAPGEMIVDRAPTASVTAANEQQKAAIARMLASLPSADDQVTAVLQKISDHRSPRSLPLQEHAAPTAGPPGSPRPPPLNPPPRTKKNQPSS